MSGETGNEWRDRQGILPIETMICFHENDTPYDVVWPGPPVAVVWDGFRHHFYCRGYSGFLLPPEFGTIKKGAKKLQDYMWRKPACIGKNGAQKQATHGPPALQRRSQGTRFASGKMQRTHMHIPPVLILLSAISSIAVHSHGSTLAHRRHAAQEATAEAEGGGGRGGRGEGTLQSREGRTGAGEGAGSENAEEEAEDP